MDIQCRSCFLILIIPELRSGKYQNDFFCLLGQVIGKASVLDEIINYIQSLQCQVEVCHFLTTVASMELHPPPYSS